LDGRGVHDGGHPNGVSLLNLRNDLSYTFSACVEVTL